MSNVGVCACVCVNASVIVCRCCYWWGCVGTKDCSVFDFFICGTTKRLKNKRDEKENHKSAGGG